MSGSRPGPVLHGRRQRGPRPRPESKSDSLHSGTSSPRVTGGSRRVRPGPFPSSLDPGRRISDVPSPCGSRNGRVPTLDTDVLVGPRPGSLPGALVGVTVVSDSVLGVRSSEERRPDPRLPFPLRAPCVLPGLPHDGNGSGAPSWGLFPSSHHGSLRGTHGRPFRTSTPRWTEGGKREEKEMHG